MNFATFLHTANTLKTEPEKLKARQEGAISFTGVSESDVSDLFEHHFSHEALEVLGARNCQNMIGAVTVPVGVVGPVKITAGDFIDAEVLIPLATTEGALVASVQRGCKAIHMCGGAAVLVEQRGMTRAPVFRCNNGEQAKEFFNWVLTQQAIFEQAAQEISSHLTFLGLKGWIEGRLVFLRCSYDPDQAMGMNMVTLAVQKALDSLMVSDVAKQTGAAVVALSSNLCTDKKQATINTLLGRGWWVQAEAFISGGVLKDVLKTSAEALLDVQRVKNEIGSRLAGGAAGNMHIANIAAAFLIATGQDAAHTVDISQGNTTIEREGDGVYVSVTLPSVPVGVIGGGTWLPAQKQARRIMVSGKELSAGGLAAALGAAALAGELSGLAALASHDLAKAHKALGQGKKL